MQLVSSPAKDVLKLGCCIIQPPCSVMQGSHLPAMPVVIGEVGAKDWGNNSISNTDTTVYSLTDREWLQATGAYLNTLAGKTGKPTSWFFWAWNANSGINLTAVVAQAGPSRMKSDYSCQAVLAHLLWAHTHSSNHFHQLQLTLVSAIRSVPGDTHGIVGPRTTWREVQWTKVRMLTGTFGLRPWYCKWQPEFCEIVQW